MTASVGTTATIDITVNGLGCAFCAQGIEKKLKKFPATAGVVVNCARCPGDPVLARSCRGLRRISWVIYAIAVAICFYWGRVSRFFCRGSQDDAIILKMCAVFAISNGITL